MVELWLWSQKQDIGPSPRGFHTMTYESQKQKTFLFGGVVSFANNYVNDTQVADTGPPPRGAFAMGYDSHRNKTVLFGGVDMNSIQIIRIFQFVILLNLK
jgi:hypothetical protein